ncbi:MAG: DUF4276 family protein [Planctomycetaceae bacterium]
MKVLIVSEGRSEHLSATGTHPRTEEGVAGALRRLVCRINEHSTEWEITEDKLSSQNVRAHHGKGKGYEKRCVRWMLEAEKRGFDAIVLLMDRDRIDARIPEVDAAQASTLPSIQRALGVAVESFEAWMLADQVALSKVFGSPVQRQPDPESTANPKEAFRRLLQVAQFERSNSEHFAEICAIMNLAELKSRCPRGFAPFAERVRSL